MLKIKIFFFAFVKLVMLLKFHELLGTINNSECRILILSQVQSFRNNVVIMSLPPPTFVGRRIVFVLSVCLFVSLTNAKKNILIFNINKDIIRIIESNTGDRSSSVFDYFSYTDIPPNFFFPCSEILLGCVLFGHIS
jgi:hypothetical protein